MEFIKLNNGIEMPNLGLGTFLLNPTDAYNSVLSALKLGYRLIDTANMYGNERAVGRAIKDSGIDRKEIFVSTKIWATEYANEHAVEDTLERLGLDYIDLLFVHQPTHNWRSGYKQIVDAYKKGTVRSIGVSNFEGKYLDELMKDFDVHPQVIQVECHPIYQQKDLREQIKDSDIKIMCWFPLGGMKLKEGLLSNDVIKEISEKYDKSSAQIILRWHTQMGFIVIPGSKNITHIQDNFDIYSFKLDDEDIKNICNLDTNIRLHPASEEKLIEYSKRNPIYEPKE